MSEVINSSRRIMIRRLLSTQKVIHSQDELLSYLKQFGHNITQSTLSRDLRAIGVKRQKNEDGTFFYTLDENGVSLKSDKNKDLVELMQRLVLDIDSSQNLAVVKTLSGSGNAVAAALDKNPLKGVMATLAGDDTILIVSKEPNGGVEIARNLMRLLAKY